MGFLSSNCAKKERERAEKEGRPYKGDVGHIPDTTWTGTAEPYKWMDIDPRVNASLGGQAGRYPIGYRPTIFTFEEDIGSNGKLAGDDSGNDVNQ